jgi:hypothetical protein
MIIERDGKRYSNFGTCKDCGHDVYTRSFNYTGSIVNDLAKWFCSNTDCKRHIIVETSNYKGVLSNDYFIPNWVDYIEDV